ncbi:receptor family ligand binding region domain-containing protein [Ditylenchus destructor]|nr:receptor family ligand binding region domain-containing protein [Ditylenchus destructor]
MFSLLTLTTNIITHVNILSQALEEANVFGPSHVRQLRIPGDLIIGGVFPVHAKGSSGGSPCGEIFETRGVHRVEAMLYALDMINQQTDFLRGYKLGALILDSCSNPAYALNQSLDFVRDMIGSADASEFQCSDGRHPMSRNTPKKSVVAVVGASYSSVTVQIANLLRLFRIVQVSPASTNADLSDKSRFEYFARTVPSDNYQARAMIDIASYFNWTYISLVYSSDEYGELGADAFKKEARRANICIAIEERVSTKPESLSESIDNLVKKLRPYKEVGARVVVLFVGTEYIPLLMEHTAERMQSLRTQSGENEEEDDRNQKRIIWLASEGWDRNNDAYTVGNRRAAAEGAIVLMLESQRVPSFEQYYLSLYPGQEKFERNKWLRELWRFKFNCEFDLPQDSTLNKCEAQRQSKENFNPDDKVQFVIEAVYAIAHALQAMKMKVCPDDTIESSWISRYAKLPEVCSAMRKIDGNDFYQYLLNVKFEDLVGKRVHFSPQGDGPAHYTILNYQPSAKRSKSSDSDRTDYVEVGRWSLEQLEINDELLFWNSEGGKKEVPISQCSMPCPHGYRKQLIKADEVCCWACGKCEEYEFLPNETACVDCGQGFWPTEDRQGCFDLVVNHLKHMRWSTWHAIIPAIFAFTGIVSTFTVISVYIIHAETPVVKASGRELSFILLCSMIMCYAMTFVLISRPTTLICAIKRTGIGFAFSCLYSALLVKTNRIHRIFSQATKSAKRPEWISPISQVCLTSLLAGIQLLGSLIWLIIVPPGTRHIYPTRDQVVLTCNIPDHHFLYSLAYDAALIVMCTVYAVKTRKVPENFNETKFIGFSMYSTCIMWLCWILFFFGTGISDFEIQTTALCISISMSANAALVCIFSPKLYIILFQKHKNVRKQDGESMLKRSYRATIQRAYDDGTAATQYTALLADQRKRNSIKSSSQPSPSVTSTAQDTFL